MTQFHQYNAFVAYITFDLVTFCTEGLRKTSTHNMTPSYLIQGKYAVTERVCVIGVSSRRSRRHGTLNTQSVPIWA